MKRSVIIWALVAVALCSYAQPPTDADFYLRESIPLPEGEVIEVGSIALLPNKRLAVSTRRGDVWICDGAYADDLSKVRWQLFFRGLHEPFGMSYKEGWLILTDRSGVVRIRDDDGDGRGDVYQTLCDKWGVSGQYHEYAFGSEPDKDGNVWVVLCLTKSSFVGADWRGWCVRVAPSGKMIPTCSGIRSPGGIGFNDSGDAFYCDNQGIWNGSSSLKHLKPGGFMGHPSPNQFWPKESALGPRPADPKNGSRMVAESAKIPQLVPPAVVFPHGKVGQSPTGIIYDQSNGAFGPFANQLLVGEHTHAQVQRVDLEQVKGVYQGAVWHFLKDFDSAVVPMRMSDQGTLFVGGTRRGWPSRSKESFALERVRWTGRTPFETKTMRIHSTGFDLTFTEPVDLKSASDVASYKMKAWTYIYQHKYGSPEVDARTPKISQAVVSNDGLKVRLTVDRLVKGHVHQLTAAGLRSGKGEALWHDTAYYTVNEIPAEPNR